MEFAADFIAIDFETASRRSDSACQLGAVKVRGGKIVDSAMWLIRPEPMYFSPMNIQIHGIRPEHVQDQPVFGQRWDEISEYFGDDCLVAHNASFDIGVMLACLRKSRESIPDMHFTCTRAIARRTWPQRPRYGLKPLSEWLGTQFRHHDALEDSFACAKILIAAGIAKTAKSLPDLESQLRLTRGRAGDWGMKGPMFAAKRSYANSSSFAAKQSFCTTFVSEPNSDYKFAVPEPKIDIQRLLIRADFIKPLRGQHVVFAGRMQQISQDDAQQLTRRLGGQCEDAVTNRTNILVVGVEKSPNDSNQQAAQTLREQGQTIRILNEHEFLSLLITL